MFRAHVLETYKGMKQILCIKLVKYWYKYTEMHDQQNVKNSSSSCPSYHLEVYYYM